MIILTTNSQINSVLGGNVPVAYDKLILSQIVFDPRQASVQGTLALSSTSEPDMQDITGSLNIDVALSRLRIAVQQLDFYRQVTLTADQKTAVRAIINSSQDALESGLISLGVIDGVQTTGT